MNVRKLTIGLALCGPVAFAGNGDMSSAANRLIPQLVRSVDQNRIARSKLLALGSRAIPVLVNSMSSRDEMIRSQCAEILAQMGAKTLPALAQAIHSPEWRIRASACLAIGAMKPSFQGTRILVAALSDDDWWVRSLAATNLSGTQDQIALSALRKLQSESNQRVASRATTALEPRGTVAGASPR